MQFSVTRFVVRDHQPQRVSFAGFSQGEITVQLLFLIYSLTAGNRCGNIPVRRLEDHRVAQIVNQKRMKQEARSSKYLLGRVAYDVDEQEGGEASWWQE